MGEWQKKNYLQVLLKIRYLKKRNYNASETLVWVTAWLFWCENVWVLARIDLLLSEVIAHFQLMMANIEMIEFVNFCLSFSSLMHNLKKKNNVKN